MGTLGQARSAQFDTGSSQFFVTLSPQPHLEGAYTIFGTVRSGANVLSRITVGDRIRRIRFIWKFSRWLPPVARTVSQGAFASQFPPKPVRWAAIRPDAPAGAPGGLETFTRTHCEHSEVGTGQYLWKNRRANMNPIGNGACTHKRRDVQVPGPRLDGWHDYDKSPTRNAMPAA